MLTPREIATYLGAVDWLVEILGRSEVVQAWDAPSALARYTTGGVAAHAVYGGVIRLVQLLEEPEMTSASPLAVADFFGANRVNEPTDDDPLFVLLREGAEKAARRGHPRLVSTCTAARAELAHRLPLTPANRILPVARVPGAGTTASDYVRTRVLEVVVHGDDLVASAAIGGVPDPPAAAMEVCLGLCLELARAHAGDVGVLRAFTRAERSEPGALRVL
ncbi:MAG TPA: maleylpyruvate isomerase N-terminal domain-containing protein [Acidimicrobiales bacterium]|nr:maleylpyruvate isomerase N-terminal domain-containing protein [Acidimicrobiales bacterium]